MKVQKILRAQGEYAKPNQDFKDGDTLAILDGGQIITGNFGDQTVFKISVKGADKNLAFNQTSINNLIEEFGDDTDKWVGKQVKAWIIRQSVSGQLKNVCYLTATNWEMVEDAKGNLTFARANGTQSYQQPLDTEIKTEDIPF